MRIEVTRNPFKINTLTSLMRYYKFVSEVRRWFPGLGKKWIKRRVDKSFRQKGRLGTASHVIVETHYGFPEVSFEASEINTQLSAIYFDRYRKIY